jgi:hypothetical protein
LANPFEITPVNPMMALMSGVQGFEGANKRMKEADMQAGRQEAMQALQSGGDPRGALARLIGIGDVQGAKAIADFADNQATTSHRQAQLTETARHNRASEGLLSQRINKLDASPPQDPAANFKDEQGLRKEHEANIKPYLDVRRGYERVVNSRDDAAGDISLVYGFMKMLDPGSVVREGEYATAQNAAGIPDRVRNMYNQAISGERLTPGQRTQFKGQAKAHFGAADKEYKARTKYMEGLATRYGFDPSRVITDIGEMPAEDAGGSIVGNNERILSPGEWQTLPGGIRAREIKR